MVERKPDPEPYAAKEVQLIGAASVIWVVVGLIMFLSGATADRLWTCGIGLLLGLNGIRIAIKRKRRFDSNQPSN